MNDVSKNTGSSRVDVMDSPLSSSAIAANNTAFLELATAYTNRRKRFTI